MSKKLLSLNSSVFQFHYVMKLWHFVHTNWEESSEITDFFKSYLCLLLNDGRTAKRIKIKFATEIDVSNTWTFPNWLLLIPRNCVIPERLIKNLYYFDWGAPLDWTSQPIFKLNNRIESLLLESELQAFIKA